MTPPIQSVLSRFLQSSQNPVLVLILISLSHSPLTQSNNNNNNIPHTPLPSPPLSPKNVHPQLTSEPPHPRLLRPPHLLVARAPSPRPRRPRNLRSPAPVVREARDPRPREHGRGRRVHSSVYRGRAG